MAALIVLPAFLGLGENQRAYGQPAPGSGWRGGHYENIACVSSSFFANGRKKFASPSQAPNRITHLWLAGPLLSQARHGERSWEVPSRAIPRHARHEHAWAPASRVDTVPSTKT